MQYQTFEIVELRKIGTQRTDRCVNTGIATLLVRYVKAHQAEDDKSGARAVYAEAKRANVPLNSQDPYSQPCGRWARIDQLTIATGC